MIKVRQWDGFDLRGTWQFTRKIDGVRAFLGPTGARSRANKPLYNLGTFLPYEGLLDVEVYLGSFVKTITAVRSQSHQDIRKSALYSLDPIDERLVIKNKNDPEAAYIQYHMMQAIADGFEGLVLRQENTWLKVKPVETYDVPVLAVIPGKGKYAGKMGALLTPLGKVGTGFANYERETKIKLGTIIEVSCMQLTPDGLFRHPRFVRWRPDKEAPNVHG